LFGVSGLGISYLTTYFLYYLLVLFLVRRQIRLKYSRENKLLVLFTLASAVGVSILTAVGNEFFRNVFALPVCCASVIISFLVVTKNLSYELPKQKQSI
jgi:O-antigen/teichoic acid export membrane protein